MARPRVLLADDHNEFLEAEATLLRPYFEVIGTVNNGASLVSEAQRLNPDVVVADIIMPVMNGIEAVRNLTESGSPARFVFLTIQSGEEFVRACLESGARGYVWKSCMKAHLVPAIRAVLEGLPYISPLSPS